MKQTNKALCGRHIKARLPQLPPEQPDDAEMRSRDARAVPKPRWRCTLTTKRLWSQATSKWATQCCSKTQPSRSLRFHLNLYPWQSFQRKGSMISAKRGNQVVKREKQQLLQEVSQTLHTCWRIGWFPWHRLINVEPNSHSQTDTPNAEHAHNSPIHHPQNTQTPVNPRRSPREKKLPCKLKDFILEWSFRLTVLSVKWCYCRRLCYRLKHWYKDI